MFRLLSSGAPVATHEWVKRYDTALQGQVLPQVSGGPETGPKTDARGCSIVPLFIVLLSTRLFFSCRLRPRLSAEL